MHSFDSWIFRYNIQRLDGWQKTPNRQSPLPDCSTSLHHSLVTVRWCCLLPRLTFSNQQFDRIALTLYME